MNTYYALLITYGKPQVKLSVIWPDFLPHLSARLLKARASQQELPFPVLKGESQKSEVLVDLRDLAKYIDDTRDEAIRVHQRMGATSTPDTCQQPLGLSGAHSAAG